MTKFIKYFLTSFIFILISYFYFYQLGYENVNEDQLRWYDRTQGFFEALNNRDFAGTYQQYHPGVFFMFFIKGGFEVFKVVNNLSFDSYKEVSYNLFPILNFYTKFFLVLFVVFSILLSCKILNEIFGKFVAIGFLVYLSFDTFFIGITRNLHMDSLLAILVFVSILSFYRFFQTKAKKYLLICAFYSGFGLLTKSVFLISILFQFLIFVYFSFKDKSIIKNFSFFLLNIVLSCAIFVILFPSMWINPIQTISKVFLEGAIETGLGGGDNFMHYFNGFEILDPGYKFYFQVLIFRLSPMLFFSILLILTIKIFEIIKHKKYKIIYDPFIILSFLILLLYFSFLFYSSKKTDRYLSVMYPFLALITSYYLKDCWMKLTSKAIKFTFLSFIGINLILNFIIHPFYFGFYNPIFGGQNQAQKRFYINQGGIMYLEVINETKNFPNKKISAINYTELIPASSKRVYELNYYKFKEPRFIKILPLQRGENLIGESKLVKTIDLMGQPFWRIYE